MSGPCAYAIFTLYCVVCRVRALDASMLSVVGALRPEECYRLSRPSFACQVLELGRKALI
jgi:hypothetical protein